MPDIDEPTVSEKLFAEYCRSNCIHFERINRASNSKSPDFLLRIKNQNVIVEIKQFDSNEEDERFRHNLETKGNAFREYDVRKSAQRVQRHIKTANKQILSHLKSHPNLPSMLILYDNSGCNHYTNQYYILTALFGLESITFQEIDLHKFIEIDRGFGPKNHRLLNPFKPIAISCIGTLTYHLKELNTLPNLTPSIYHNPIAKRKIDPHLFANLGITQFRISDKKQGEFQRWELINLRSNDGT